MKQRVLTKLSAFFGRFFGLGATGAAMGDLKLFRIDDGTAVEGGRLKCGI
jgi:hypothetical protein